MTSRGQRDDHIPALLSATAVERSLAASRDRCWQQHRLTPERTARPPVLTASELHDRRERVSDLLALSHGEVQRLFELLAEQDYLVLLTDDAGVAVGFRGNEAVLDACAAAGVHPGSVWSEDQQGTNGVGLCLLEQQPMSVVMADHFATSLSRVSCTVAPIFGAAGQLAAVLNVTTLRPTDHATQSIVRKLVAASARRIENLYFDRRHSGNTVLRISNQVEFCDVAVESRVALDGAGRVLDVTPDAQRMFAAAGTPLIGQSLAAMHGLDGWLKGTPNEHTAVALDRGRLFIRLQAPTSLRVTRRGGHEAGKDASERLSIQQIVGHDQSVAAAVDVARRLVGHRVPVLLQGDTGTGKSALAKALFLDAGGDEDKFVAVNCAAISAELIESELFGYRPGAFTGASRHGSPGRLLEADGGMLFLDEIGDMPLALQTRLLQVLSDGEFVPVGAVRPVRVSFALVAATLHDIPQRVREGRFREDLYYRLAGATVRLPAMRDRADRIELIERAFAQAAARAGRPAPAIARDARRAMADYAWPGNLRELHHAARFALAVDTDGTIACDDLPPLPVGAACPASGTPPGKHQRVTAALVQADWNVSAAAKRLGVSRSTVHRMMRALGIERPD